MEGGHLKSLIESNGHPARFGSQYGTADFDVGAGTTPAFQFLEIKQQVHIDARTLSQWIYGGKVGTIGTYICGNKIEAPWIAVQTHHFDRGGSSKVKPFKFSLIFHVLDRLSIQRNR